MEKEKTKEKYQTQKKILLLFCKHCKPYKVL